jgi:aldehyde dehydrogenase (NAD+)
MTLTADARSETTPQLVGRLRATFDSGRTRPVSWRRVQLERMRSMLVRHEDEFLAALGADLGKPAAEGYLTDIAYPISEIDYTLKHLDDWANPDKARLPMIAQPGRARVVPEPLGVVLVIAPWNYPAQLLLMPMAGAIAAGNAVIGKPSEIASHTSELIATLVPKYVDTEAVAIVEGGVTETTELLEQRFDHIFYTGNGHVGRVVMEAAVKHLTPVTLELGGKSPVIVDADARMNVAARRITWGKFLNAGQTCIAPDYVLVHRDAYDGLVDGIRKSVSEFYGADPKASPDYARIVSDRHFERLQGLLSGGQVLLGGDTAPAERYFSPTVLVDVDVDSPVMREEIFGPILPIVPVASVDEAIAFVNERDKPLALYAFSESSDTQQQVIDRTSSGGVCVNHTILHITPPDLPFGGVGESGMGAYHGRKSFDTFTHYKSVLSKPTRIDPKLVYPPMTERKQKIVRRFM